MVRRFMALAIACTTAQLAATYLFRRERRAYAGARRHVLVTQGGSQVRLAGDELIDVVVSVMMGGVVLDLRESELTHRPVHLEILAIMGGVELVVPAEWKVRVDVEPTMGGIHDGRRGRIDAERAPDMVVSGRIVMGGLDISSDVAGWRDSR